MAVPWGIDVKSGCLLLGSARLVPLNGRADAVARIAVLSPSFPFGHARTAVLEVTVGDEPATLFLIFRDDQLIDAWLSIGEDWALGNQAQRLVHRVNDLLLREHGIEVNDGYANFPWGVVYSLVNRGGGASVGVRYGPDALNVVVDM